MNEQVFLGGCPVIRPEGIYLDGQRVIRFGLHGVGVGDVGDLLAYRQEWEPFIAAHLALWRSINDFLENNSAAKQCAPVFTTEQANPKFCAALARSRIRVSDTDPGGILPQWNAWKDKSSADILAGAASMLKWHQDVVLRVGGQYKDELTQIANDWGIAIQLPDLPSFTTQQQIKARIEGAYISTKGVIQLVGYGVGETLGMVSDVAQALSQGLSDTAKQLPKTTRWIGIVATVAAVVVGGALIVYYVPRRTPPPPSLPAA